MWVKPALHVYSRVTFHKKCCSKVFPSNIRVESLNSEFSFFSTVYHIKVKEPNLFYCLLIVEMKIVGCIPVTQRTFGVVVYRVRYMCIMVNTRVGVDIYTCLWAKKYPHGHMCKDTFNVMSENVCIYVYHSRHMGGCRYIYMSIQGLKCECLVKRSR